jgi:hypothetical protein
VGDPFGRAIIVGGASYWSSNKEVLGLLHDDGIYVVIAKSLSDGAGYRIISLPTALDQTKYPFLYSYILSWVWSFYPEFPDNIGLLKAANGAFLVAIFILSYLFYRQCAAGEESEGLLFAALVCTNPAVFSFTDFTVSDVLFLMLSLSAFLTLDVLAAVQGARLPTSWQGFSETFQWIRSHTDDKVVLATVYDPMYYLYTGRRAIRPGFHKPQTYFYP